MKLLNLSTKSAENILLILLFLFILRVVGQLLVANNLAPYLPPMNQWQSGLLPYPLLLFFQIIIIAIYARVCIDLKTKKGFFFYLQPKICHRLNTLGLIYFVSMIIRYIIYMSLVPEARWLNGTIPIMFHLVLASFLIVYANTGVSEYGKTN